MKARSLIGLAVMLLAGVWSCGGESPGDASDWSSRLEAAKSARSMDQAEVADSLLEQTWREIQAWDPEDPRRLEVLSALAREFRPSRNSLADSLYARILRTPELDLPDTVRSSLEVEWAQIAQKLRHPAEAESLLRSALARDEQAVGPEHPRLVEDTRKLAWFLLSRGRFEESHALYERSLELSRAVYGEDDARVADALMNLAVSSRRLGDLEKTEALYLHALSIAERADGPYSARAALVLTNYAFFLKGMGRNAEAKAQLARIEEIRKAQREAKSTEASSAGGSN